MVDRVSPKTFEEFVGTVKNVTKESNQLEGQATEQYHLEIDAEGIEIKGKTGLIHEWIRLSKTAKEDTIPEGSVVDRYLQQIELCLPEAKKAKNLSEAFAMMKGKKFNFKKMKLGRAFEGHDAREYWVCQALA